MHGFKTRVAACHFLLYGASYVLCQVGVAERLRWSYAPKDVTCKNCIRLLAELAQELRRRAGVK